MHLERLDLMIVQASISIDSDEESEKAIRSPDSTGTLEPRRDEARINLLEGMSIDDIFERKTIKKVPVVRLKRASSKSKDSDYSLPISGNLKACHPPYTKRKARRGASERISLAVERNVLVDNPEGGKKRKSEGNISRINDPVGGSGLVRKFLDGRSPSTSEENTAMGDESLSPAKKIRREEGDEKSLDLEDHDVFDDEESMVVEAPVVTAPVAKSMVDVVPASDRGLTRREIELSLDLAEMGIKERDTLNRFKIIKLDTIEWLMKGGKSCEEIKGYIELLKNIYC